MSTAQDTPTAVRVFQASPPTLAYTIAEACSASRLSRSTIHRLIHGGKLPTVTVGSRRLILHDDLMAFLLANRDAS